MRRLLPLAVLCPLAFACAHARVLDEQWTNSVASIRTAQEAGADNLPAASTYLNLAREEAGRAQDLVRQGKKREADLMLQRAEADAELALSLTKEEPLRAEADRAQQQLRSLGTP